MIFVSISGMIIYWCDSSIYEKNNYKELTKWLMLSFFIFSVSYVFLHYAVYGTDSYEISQFDWLVIGIVGGTCLILYSIAFHIINLRKKEVYYKEATVALLRFYLLECVMQNYFDLPNQDDEIEKIYVSRDGVLTIVKTILVLDGKNQRLFEDLKDAYKYFPRVNFFVKTKKVKLIARFPIKKKLCWSEKRFLELAMNKFLVEEEMKRIWDTVPEAEVWRWGF